MRGARSVGWRRAVATSGFGGIASARRVLRFGHKLRGDDVPTVPTRFRGIYGPTGRLVGVRLRPATGDLWLRMERRPPGSRLPWKHELWTVALNGEQPPAPTPDTIELRRGMRVASEEGYIGRVEGIAIDTRAGVATELLVHIRSDVLAAVDLPTSPLAPLIGVAGRRLLLSPAWAVAVKAEESTLPFSGTDATLHLNATAEQIASGAELRSDEDVAGAIWAVIAANPALAPYAPDMQVSVHDGDVTVRGTVPTPRHRASLGQDIWHVPGVIALHDELRVTRS